MQKTGDLKSRLRKKLKLLDWIIVILVQIISLVLITNYSQIKELAQHELASYGFTAIFVFIFIIELLPQILSPDYIILLGIAAGFDIQSSVLVAMIASASGSWLAYFLGYKYGFKVIANLVEKSSLDNVIRFWGKNGKIYVLLSAIVPLPIPYFPLVFGALRMSRKDFLFWGIIPRMLGFVLTGILGYYGLHLFSQF